MLRSWRNASCKRSNGIRTGGDVRWPANLRSVTLPPSSPELNPMARLRDELNPNSEVGGGVGQASSLSARAYSPQTGAVNWAAAAEPPRGQAARSDRLAQPLPQGVLSRLAEVVGLRNIFPTRCGSQFRGAHSRLPPQRTGWRCYFTARNFTHTGWPTSSFVPVAVSWPVA